jgi:thiol-disulfide isomerase/thioredoxin
MRLLIKSAVLALLASFFFQGCISADQTYQKVAPGRWRALLDLAPVAYQPKSKKEVLTIHDQFAAGQCPFQFDVIYTENDKFYVEIINGSERIRVDDVTFGHSRRTARDTIRINFPEYQSYLIADVRGGLMNGHWVVTTKDDYRVPFAAKFAEPYRFTNMNTPPTQDISGEWAALFGINEEKTEKAIGEFVQKENLITGTFRTETGDYRFLEGTVQSDKFWLSCFDGAHAFLFSGKMFGDSIRGEFRSGSHYQTLWTGWRDPNFKLAAADTLSRAKDGGAGIKFSLPASSGEQITYPSADFQGKVKLFTISGTWCPNCKDEQLFLKDYFEKHPDMKEKVQVVSFSFERYKDSTQVMQHLQAYKQKLGLDWPLVLAGTAKKEEAQRVFPSLSRVVAFPTMIVLDKTGKVHQVHTGFDGPATSKYGEFAKEFDAMMQGLTK